MQLTKKMLIGGLLCVIAVIFGAVVWMQALGNDLSTDNAYVRGDVMSLAPKIGGYVTAVEVEDNQPVKASDILFRINDRDYQARLAQAKANVQAARARLTSIDAKSTLQQAMIRQATAQRQSAIAELGLATKASNRQRALIRSNAVSQAQVDKSNAARIRAKAAVDAKSAALEAQRERIKVLATQREAAVATVAQAEAARDLARIDLESTIVRAPVGGVVGNRHVRVGRLVSPGTPLLDIVSVDNVWLIANFKETQIEDIRPGQQARISVDSYPDRVFDGVVDSLAPASGSAFSLLPADNATGNFIRVVQRVPVKIRFVNFPLPGHIVPGLSARITVIRDSGS